MPEDNKKEVDQFFADLPTEDETVADIFAEEKEPVPEKDEVVEETPHKNRKHRRWEQQLEDKERELIRKEAELAAKEKYSQPTKTDSEVPAEWLALYGDTPEALKAWKMQESLLTRYKQDAKAEALQELASQREREAKEQKDYEAYIDSQLESLEDDNNVDLTSDSPAARKSRREFLELVEKLSPKNESGEITGFADFSTTWEIYSQTRQKPSTNVQQKKTIAAQSMSKSGAVDGKKVNDDSQLSYLRSIGINI